MRPLRIAVCYPVVPFESGGAELHYTALCTSLEAAGHAVQRIEIPFVFSPKLSLLKESLIWRTIEIRDIFGREPDLVIATRFPSYYVQHYNKVVWLFHQHRAAYDLFGTAYSDFQGSTEDLYYRDLITRMDNMAFSEATALYTTSRVVAERLARYNGARGHVLPVPPVRADWPLTTLQDVSYNGPLLLIGRLTPPKRVSLALRALALTPPETTLEVVGTGPEADKLRREAAELGLTGQVSFLGRVSDEVLHNKLKTCRGVVYVPHDEDFGLVTGEAFSHGKPLVTCSDSGGPLEWVRDGINGLIVEPTSEALASAFMRLNVSLARRLSVAAFESARSMPTWREVVATLVHA